MQKITREHVEAGEREDQMRDDPNEELAIPVGVVRINFDVATTEKFSVGSLLRLGGKDTE